MGGGRGRQSKRGSGKWAGVEMYTAPSIQAHFQLAFDVCSLAMLISTMSKICLEVISRVYATLNITIVLYCLVCLKAKHKVQSPESQY